MVARWLAIAAVGSLLAVGCGVATTAPPPATLEVSIAAARSELSLREPVELLRGHVDGGVFVLYAEADGGAVGVVMIEAVAPWARIFTGAASVGYEEFGGVSISKSSDTEGNSEVFVFGVVNDSRIGVLELDLGPDGLHPLPVKVPGFAFILPFDSEVRGVPTWRFLAHDGTSPIYEPYR